MRVTVSQAIPNCDILKVKGNKTLRIGRWKDGSLHLSGTLEMSLIMQSSVYFQNACAGCIYSYYSYIINK